MTKYFFLLITCLMIQSGLIVSSFYLTAYHNHAKHINFKKDFLQYYLFPLKMIKPEQKEEFMQSKAYTCGPAALSYLLSLYGIIIRETELSEYSQTTIRGTSLQGLINAAKHYGFVAWGEKQDIRGLLECPKPLIAHINNNHYIVVEKIRGENIIFFDPELGRANMKLSLFNTIWSGYVAIIDVNEPLKELYEHAKD